MPLNDHTINHCGMAGGRLGRYIELMLELVYIVDCYVFYHEIVIFKMIDPALAAAT